MKEKFDQKKYQQKWDKENLLPVYVKYKAAFVKEFRAACKKIDKSQSEVIREVMEETIKKAKEYER